MHIFLFGKVTKVTLFHCFFIVTFFGASQIFFHKQLLQCIDKRGIFFWDTSLK